MFVHLGDELRLIQKCGECASQIHLHGQVCPCCAAELVGHFIGFTVTLGCFKVDGKCQNRAVCYGHQIGTFIFCFSAASVQFPAIGVVTDRSDDFYKLVDGFGGKTSTVNINFCSRKSRMAFMLAKMLCVSGAGVRACSSFFQTSNLIIGLFAKSLIFFTFQLAVCPHSTVIELALLDFFSIWP